MAHASDLKLGDLIRVRDWPGTRGRLYTVSRVEERGAVHVWDRDMQHHAFPLANVHKVKPKRGVA